jgi:ribosomal protein S18 acetylase RimI-like enzyme
MRSCRQQFDAQDAWNRGSYRGATFDREIRIVDIALLPEYRGKGIGNGLLRDLLAEADADRESVTIHVERLNPALRLYERLGFAVAEDKGVYLFLEAAAGYVKTAS